MERNLFSLLEKEKSTMMWHWRKPQSDLHSVSAVIFDRPSSSGDQRQHVLLPRAFMRMFERPAAVPKAVEYFITAGQARIQIDGRRL
jgi:hypothetical protein